ncbi:MAG: invasion associated locus B family protein [Pseudomonadota bacterium]
MRLRLTALTAAIVASALTAFAVPAHAQGAKFLKSFKDWSAYNYEGTDKKICFAVSQPKDFEPKNLDRSDIYFYVSDWPNQSVNTEVSIKAGYSYKSGSTTTATIGPNVFELFTDGDKAFVQSPETERDLVRAMRRGSRMIVKGRNADGTETTDVYSLSGITAALNYVAKNCK